MLTVHKFSYLKRIDYSFGFSGAVAMNLTVCKKQVEKQWRQEFTVTVHKFSYLKRVDLKNV